MAFSTAVKRLGEVFVLFREILFTMKWKHEQGCITIAVECKCIPISLKLLLNAPHPDKVALTNGVNKSEFAHFQILRTFLVKFQKKLVSQQDTGKVTNFEQ